MFFCTNLTIITLRLYECLKRSPLFLKAWKFVKDSHTHFACCIVRRNTAELHAKRASILLQELTKIENDDALSHNLRENLSENQRNPIFQPNLSEN